jgi:large subunit ribosomal protein L5
VAEKKTTQVAKAVATDSGLPRYKMKDLYREVAVPALIKRFGYANINQVPKLEKIVLNMGLGDCKDNSKSLNLAVDELKIISGQKPVVTKAKKSVANFKVRTGMNVGAKVTLRGNRMFDFFEKFISIALPRVRDFKGTSLKSFDGRGNYAMGVKEQLIFPEISYDKIEKVRGFDICFVTSAKTDEEARELLKLLGMPFQKGGN